MGDLAARNPRRVRRPRKFVPLIAALSVVALVWIGFSPWVWVSVSTSVPTCDGDEFGGACQVYGGSLDLPAGTNVTLTWQDRTDGVVSVTVIAPTGYEVYPCIAVGASGGCGFVSAGGAYRFVPGDALVEPDQIVTFTASYYRALL